MSRYKIVEKMNIENTDYREEFLDLGNPFDIKLVKDFLTPLGFDFDENQVDYTVIIYNLNDEVLGVGSSQKAVLKYVAVAPKYRETTVFALLVTHLLDRLLKRYEKIFAFTKPLNIPRFEGLGFRKIAIAEPLFSVLEYGLDSIKDYVKKLEGYKKEGDFSQIASLVVNCNPVTNGHLYLIEKAAKENDWVYLFVVQEDLSSFPFEVRWELIKKVIAHIPNITMIPGGDYIVSGKTFPSYFLKDNDITDVMKKQAELDVVIFRDYIVPVLGINHRYVGEEVYCPTTAAYNLAMKEILPQAGVEVVEVHRKKDDNEGECISASRIRKAIRNDELGKVANFLPEATLEYLKSEESLAVREKIKITPSRH